MGRGYVMGHEGIEKKADDKLSKATTDACKITGEVLNGMMGQIIKDRLFNQVREYNETNTAKSKLD